MVNCPYCGKLTDPKLDGCPHCGGYLKKKIPKPQKSSSPSQTCPSCQAVVQSGDIICVVCGTNLLTGQKVADAPTPSQSGGGTGISTGLLVSIVVAVVALIVIGIGVAFNNSNTLGRARALIAEFKYPEAAELLNTYVRNNPDNDEAWYELGKLQWRAKQYDDAVESFETVVDINPGNTNAGLLAVLCLQTTTRASSIDREIAILERIADSAQDTAQVWHMLALALSARGTDQDIARQITALERVIDLSPNADSARLDLGIGYILDGNYRDAQFALDSIRDDTLQGNAEVSRAFMYALELNNARAISGFDRALANDGLSVRWQAQTALAQIQITQGQFRDAEQHLQSALAANPDNMFGRYLRGIALHALNRPTEALAEFEAVTRAQNAYSGLANIQAANIHLSLGNSAAAERMISIARREGIETAAFYTIFGRVQAIIGDGARARDSFDKALSMDPTYAPAYLERGLHHVNHDQIEAGVSDLNHYLTLLGRDSVGTRANEIRLLASQLQRTLAGGQH